MPSLIACPFCGLRPTEEFTPRGDAPGPRPAVDAPLEAWHDHIYLRENVRGRHLEHWHHLGGCRRWLLVERDTVTHEVYAVRDARASASDGTSENGGASAIAGASFGLGGGES